MYHTSWRIDLLRVYERLSVSQEQVRELPAPIFRRVRKIAKKRLLALSCLSVRLEQLGSHWTDFHEILRFGIFRKTVENFQFPLKSDKNNRYFTRRSIHIFYITSPSSSQNEKRFRKKLHRKSKHTFCAQRRTFKSCCYWDNVEKYCTAGHRRKYGASALHAGSLRLQIHTQNM
jgi:hypothetical protein